MKSDLISGHQHVVLDTSQPLSYSALQSGLLKASSLMDLRNQTMNKSRNQSKSARFPTSFRRFSETFKAMKSFPKSSGTTKDVRNGSISSDSGEGSLSDGQSATIETVKSILRGSEQSHRTQGERKESLSGEEDQEKTVKKKPKHLTFRTHRRLSSPVTSPTRQTFAHEFQNLGQQTPAPNANVTYRPRWSSLPDALFGSANRIETTNIRDLRDFGVGCFEEDEEVGQYGSDVNDVGKCLNLACSQPKQAKSSVLLISDHNKNELELIELNRLLDNKTLKTSAAIPDEEGMTILHRAVQSGFVNLTKFLVNSGVSTEMRDLEQRTPLWLALEKDNYECAEVLVRLGANVNCTKKGGRTILHQMAYEGNYKAVQFLVKQGSDLNLEDDKGWPALHYALKRKDLKCAALLMTHGMNIHRYTEKRIQEYSMSMEIVNIAKVRLDVTKKINNDLGPEVTVI